MTLHDIELSRGEIYVANFIPQCDGACLGNHVFQEGDFSIQNEIVFNQENPWGTHTINSYGPLAVIFSYKYMKQICCIF